MLFYHSIIQIVLSASLSLCFILRESDTSVFPSFPWVAIFESSAGSAVSVPSWNKLTLSLPRLLLPTWWERRQRTFLHSWVLDAALITAPETETWSLGVCSCLCFAQSPCESHLFVSTFVFFLSTVTLEPQQFLVFSWYRKSHNTAQYWHHKKSGIRSVQCLPGMLFFSSCVHPPTPPTPPNDIRSPCSTQAKFLPWFPRRSSLDSGTAEPRGQGQGR